MRCYNKLKRQRYNDGHKLFEVVKAHLAYLIFTFLLEVISLVTRSNANHYWSYTMQSTQYK